MSQSSFPSEDHVNLKSQYNQHFLSNLLLSQMNPVHATDTFHIKGI